MHARYILTGLVIAIMPLSAQQPLNPQLSGMAAGVLNSTQMARTAIAAGNKQDAMAHVRGALGLVDQIQEKAGARHQSLMVPVSADIEQVSTWVPVKKGKGEMTARRMKKRTSISEVSGEYTTMSLDVTNAHDKLEAARIALDSGDMKAADQDLAAVQGGVVKVAGKGDMPLARARENLTLARARVQEGKFKEAAMPLRAAARALQQYEGQSPANAQSAEVMRIQMEAYADEIRKEHAGALERINAWWDQVSGWWNQEMSGK